MTGRELLQLLLDSQKLNPHSLTNEKLHRPTLQSTLQRFLNGAINEPRRSTIEPIAAYFAVPVSAFYDPQLAEVIAVERNLIRPNGGHVKEVSAWSEDDLESGDAVEILEYNVNLQAGNGCIPEYEHNHESRPMKYELKWLKEHGINPKRSIRLKVRGSSMEPFLFEGDSVLINLDETNIIDGKVYALSVRNEGLRIKRVYKKLGGGLILHSDNQDHRPRDEELPAEFINDNIYIIGRVRDKSGTGGL